MPLRGQQGTESFPATHFAELRGEDVAQPVIDTARGIFFARINVPNRTMRFRLTVGGVANITGAHICRGGYGNEGPVVFPIDGLSDTSVTVSGNWTMSVGQVDSLLAGFLYVNVQTAEYPTGHIRAQIIPVPNALTPGISAVQEPHPVTDSSGSGESFIHVDQATKVLYYWLRWRDLTGPVAAARFHLGAVTEEGPPLKSIDILPGRNYASGSWRLDDTTYEHLLYAELYVNILTAANPDGEIRGQILPAHVFTAALDPANTVPSHADSSRGGGTGFAVVGIAPFGNFLSARAIVNGTSTPVSMAHIHVAPMGIEGPVFQPLTPIPTSPYIGIRDGIARFVTDDTVSIMLGNGTYMNAHTALFPLGEIRGQLIPAATNLTLTPSSVPMDAPSRAGLMTEYRQGADEIVVHIHRPVPGESVEVHDLLGNALVTTQVESSTVRIPAGELSSGLYFVRVKGLGTRVVSVVR